MRGTWEERLGRVAFEAYATGLSVGHTQLAWDALSPELQRVWGKVATAVVHKNSEGNPREDRMKR